MFLSFFLVPFSPFLGSTKSFLYILIAIFYLFIHYYLFFSFFPPPKMLQEYCIFVQTEIGMGCPEYIRSCMEDCWAELPEQRPDFPTIRDRLRKMREGM